MSAANVYYGVPGNITAPPSPVNISSSTNASPIVVTTGASHDLQTGQKALIEGHLVNTNANGIWTVTRLSATTFSLNGSTGNGVGVATGTVLSMRLVAFEMPEDGVDPIDASTFNIPPEALGDAVSFLWWKQSWAYNLYSGGSWTSASGSSMTIGSDNQFTGSTDVNGGWLFGTGSRLTVGVGSRFNYRAPQRLADGDHTINAGDGYQVILAQPSVIRTITVEQASDTDKEDGDWLEFYLSVPNASSAVYWRIRREGSGNDIAQVIGFVDTTQVVCHCRIHLEGGVWRLTGGSAGVTPGADA